MRQKLLTLIAVLLTAVCASAYDFEVNGIYYNVTSASDLTCGVTYGAFNYVDKVTIPSTVTYQGRKITVTSICDKAFNDCSRLTSVVIPNTISEIGNSAFYGCSNLTKITSYNTTPPSVGTNCFYDVPISTCVLNVSIEAYVAYHAAEGWKVFANVVPYSSKKCISYTSSDGKVVKPYKTDVFGANIVSNTYEYGLGIILFDGDVTNIGDYAFFGNNGSSCSRLTSVVIPNSVTTIGEHAFNSCSLTSMVIPNSVTTIGDCAFYNCTSLTSVENGNSVTEIGVEAFRYCSGLESFTGKFASDDNRCLIVNGTLKAFAPAGLTSYEIPNSVTTIGKHAFNSCSLTSVVIGKSVKYIEHAAFMYCYSLKEIISLNTTPPSVETYYCFYDVPTSSCDLKVPTKAVNSYKNAAYWSQFYNIIGLTAEEITGVEPVSESKARSSKAYNLGGQPVGEGYRGIVIRDGKKYLRK